MVYRSFAASRSWTYVAGTPSLQAIDTGANGTCKATTSTDSGEKNPITTINLACSGVGQEASAQTRGSYSDNSLLYKSFRACASVKGSGTVEMTLTVPTNNPATAKTSKYVTPTADKYSYLCTESRYINRTGAIDMKVRAFHQGTFVNVSSITLEEIPNVASTTTTTTNTSKNPTGGK